MLIVGLTGGMGAGKTTVANLFARYNIPIIDADVISHALTEVGEPAYLDIIKHFTSSILLPDKQLDRKKLRQIIFNDAQERIWLEKLLHPLIEQEMIKQIKNTVAPYCIVVIPLLFEVEHFSFIDRILLVDIPTLMQIERIKLRDKVPDDQIAAILKRQISRDEKLARADDIIANDGTFENLIPQVEEFHASYLELAKQKKNKHNKV